MEGHSHVGRLRAARTCFGKTSGMLVDDIFEIVDLLTGRIRDEHNVPTLLPHIVCSICTENRNPERRMRFLDGSYCDARVLDVMVEAVIGERLAPQACNIISRIWL